MQCLHCHLFFSKLCWIKVVLVCGDTPLLIPTYYLSSWHLHPSGNTKRYHPAWTLDLCPLLALAGPDQIPSFCFKNCTSFALLIPKLRKKYVGSILPSCWVRNKPVSVFHLPRQRGSLLYITKKRNKHSRCDCSRWTWNKKSQHKPYW